MNTLKPRRDWNTDRISYPRSDRRFLRLILPIWFSADLLLCSLSVQVDGTFPESLATIFSTKIKHFLGLCILQRRAALRLASASTFCLSPASEPNLRLVRVPFSPKMRTVSKGIASYCSFLSSPHFTSYSLYNFLLPSIMSFLVSFDFHLTTHTRPGHSNLRNLVQLNFASTASLLTSKDQDIYHTVGLEFLLLEYIPHRGVVWLEPS